MKPNANCQKTEQVDGMVDISEAIGKMMMPGKDDITMVFILMDDNGHPVVSSIKMHKETVADFMSAIGQSIYAIMKIRELALKMLGNDEPHAGYIPPVESSIIGEDDKEGDEDGKNNT